jgi:hypothetical protein
MKRTTVCAAVLVVMAGTASVLAREPDLSGTWSLEANRSSINAAAGLAGLIAAGAPDRLHITHAANGTLTVESEINESQARIYIPGDKTSTLVFVGGAGKITMVSRWENQSLVSEGRREFASSSATATDVKEILTISDDEQILEIEIFTKGGDGTSESRLIYTRTQALGPCQSWATPCKSP